MSQHTLSPCLAYTTLLSGSRASIITKKNYNSSSLNVVSHGCPMSFGEASTLHLGCYRRPEVFVFVYSHFNLTAGIHWLFFVVYGFEQTVQRITNTELWYLNLDSIKIKFQLTATETHGKKNSEYKISYKCDSCKRHNWYWKVVSILHLLKGSRWQNNGWCQNLLNF